MNESNKILGNLEISDSKISVYSSGKNPQIIQKNKIERISLEYGFSEKRPAIGFILGISFVIVGIYFSIAPMLRLYENLNDSYLVKGNGGMLAATTSFLILGIWLSANALNRGYYLKIISSNDKFKLPFNPKVNRSKLESYITDCNDSYGYKIRSNI